MCYWRFLLIRFSCLLALAAASLSGKDLDIYVIDVEGGKSVLLVSPSGQSMLFDVGWPASTNRPASTDRIIEVANAAGVQRIDFLVISHFDIDHIGDVAALAARISVGQVFDHGGAQTTPRFTAYAAIRDRIGRTVLRPGDRVPLQGVDIQVLAAGGKLLERKGAPNPQCATSKQAAELPSDVEDNNSIGLLIKFGRFRMLDLADLEAHHSHDLVCPENRIGQVDVYNVNVHGQFKGIAPELVQALRAPVIIQANGPRKGADAQSWPILRTAPGLKNIWQLHFSLNAGTDVNPPDGFIANPDGPDAFHWLKISATKSGKFAVTNTRTGFSKSY